MSAAGPVLEARKLSKRYGHVRALRDLSLRVEGGCLLAAFGPNGAGKTTLLRILAGLVRPTGGDVLVDGRPLQHDAGAVRRRIGYVSHKSMLYDSLSARENLQFVGRLHAVEDRLVRVDQLLRTLDLHDRADEPVGILSRGLRQRVSIARALLADPDLILLDEPFSGLDQHAAVVLRTLLQAVRRRGRTVVLVTHDLERGLELADRVVILEGGRLVHDAPREGLDRAALEELYLERVAGKVQP